MSNKLEVLGAIPISQLFENYDKGEFSHHGVKGMKWGVTRTDEQLANGSVHNEILGALNGIPAFSGKNAEFQGLALDGVVMMGGGGGEDLEETWDELLAILTDQGLTEEEAREKLKFLTLQSVKNLKDSLLGSTEKFKEGFSWDPKKFFDDAANGLKKKGEEAQSTLEKIKNGSFITDAIDKEFWLRTNSTITDSTGREVKTVRDRISGQKLYTTDTPKDGVTKVEVASKRKDFSSYGSERDLAEASVEDVKGFSNKEKDQYIEAFKKYKSTNPLNHGDISFLSLEQLFENYDEFKHYGVKGQKWGVRRTRKQLLANRSQTREKIKTMSDDELRSAINRIRLENDYLNLVAPMPAPSKGAKQFTADLIKETGKDLVKSQVKQYAQYGAEALVSKSVKKATGFELPKTKKKKD